MVERRLKTRLKRMLVRVRRRVPPGLRLVLGLLLMVGGVLGFLPVLGFWMLPLGVMVAALDILPLWRRLTGASPRRRPR
ncbi:MAG: putative membrane protein (DUF2298) [Rhodobacteraceae bacterium HLUCCA08]|nr:MAG: putative membrane protein (DUF2298) [Rhodobacteraceae bacterium HLUCCA08]